MFQFINSSSCSFFFDGMVPSRECQVFVPHRMLLLLHARNLENEGKRASGTPFHSWLLTQPVPKALALYLVSIFRVKTSRSHDSAKGYEKEQQRNRPPYSRMQWFEWSNQAQADPGLQWNTIVFHVPSTGSPWKIHRGNPFQNERSTIETASTLVPRASGFHQWLTSPLGRVSRLSIHYVIAIPTSSSWTAIVQSS